jgi:hypothetical protein
MKPGEIKLETEPVDLNNISSSVAMALKVVGKSGVSFPEGRAPLVHVTIRVKKK